MAETSETEQKPAIENLKDDGGQQPPRDQLIGTAIKFLQNPKVISRPLSQKKAFLQSKGLTDVEIERAIHEAGIPEIPPILPPPPQPKVSFLIKARNVSFFVSVVCGATYALYRLYHDVIKRYLFEPEDDDLKRLEIKVNDLQSSMDKTLQNISDSLQTTQQSLKEVLSATQSNQSIQKVKDLENFLELKTEISSVKALMLSRRSFPPPPNLTGGLPAWQQQQQLHTSGENGNNEGSCSTSTESVTAAEQEASGRSWEVVNEETEDLQGKSSSSLSV